MVYLAPLVTWVPPESPVFLENLVLLVPQGNMVLQALLD